MAKSLIPFPTSQTPTVKADVEAKFEKIWDQSPKAGDPRSTRRTVTVCGKILAAVRKQEAYVAFLNVMSQQSSQAV